MIEWGDRPLPEDSAIEDASPTRSGRHDLYAEAVRLVGAKRSKGSLVALVNWLLHRVEASEKELAEQEECTNRADDLTKEWHSRFCQAKDRAEAAEKRVAELEACIADDRAKTVPVMAGLMKQNDKLRATLDARDSEGGEAVVASGHMGDPEAWCYWDKEYPDEGSCGPFATETEAAAHAVEAGYAIAKAETVGSSDGWTLPKATR